MYNTSLRKVGGSVMLAVPPALLELLQLQPGAKVGIAVDDGRLIVKPQFRPRYSLAELLARCDQKAPCSKQSQDWVRGKRAGRELI